MRNQMILRIKRDNKKIKTPIYESTGASGFDLCAYITTPVFIDPKDIVIIPTGLYFEVPVGFEMQIRSRSGLAASYGIMVLNSPGTIDSDYRGEVKIILINLGSERFKVSNGDRIAQGVVGIIQQVKLLDIGTKPLSPSMRGSGGFGSTGLN
jgi:dUTP pyrophosphatase